jgi:hypothetical protein
MEVGGQAVGRDDVEARAGQQRRARLPCAPVAGDDRPEDVDLAGDIEVVRAGT